MAKRRAQLTDQDLEVLGRKVVGEGGFQTLLRRLKTSVVSRELVVDDGTFQMMKRYADGYGEGGWQGRLRELIGSMTIVTPGVQYEGSTVTHAVHGVGKVEFWKDQFPMARVKFSGGTEKVSKGELTIVSEAKPKPTIEVIWERLRRHQGETFRQIGGNEFTYSVEQDRIIPSRTDWFFPRNQIAEAVSLMPVANTVPLQHLYGPSYLYAMLMDPRIRGEDW